MKKILTIGTRPSNLALRQVEEIQALFPQVIFRIRVYRTPGDRDRTTPISDVEGTDFFTRDLDEALARNEIDVAVHSAKDLPQAMPEDLKVILETDSVSPYDCLVSHGDVSFRKLPSGASLGASSRRRKEQVRRLRPDLRVVDVRGNIEERMSLVKNGKIDALIVAEAALLRLGLESKITEVLKADEFPAHPKQGSLALVAREDRWQEVKSILSEQALATGN